MWLVGGEGYQSGVYIRNDHYHHIQGKSASLILKKIEISFKRAYIACMSSNLGPLFAEFVNSWEWSYLLLKSWLLSDNCFRSATTAKDGEKNKCVISQSQQIIHFVCVRLYVVSKFDDVVMDSFVLLNKKGLVCRLRFTDAQEISSAWGPNKVFRAFRYLKFEMWSARYSWIIL